MTSNDDSITVAVAALDEEGHLDQAVEIVIKAVERSFDSYEIIIFNDGSTDRTGEVADALAARYPHVKAVHHKRPKCVGGVIRRGLARARMKYFIWVDGKGATTEQALDSIFAHRGQADLVVPFPSNQHERSWSRRVISRTLVVLLNVLFRLNLRYYTHLVLCRTVQARQFTVQTSSYAYQAELLIKMIKSGCSYVEVAVEDRYDIDQRRTKAFKPKNVFGVLTFLFRTCRDVYIGRLWRTKFEDLAEYPRLTHHTEKH